MTKTLLSFSAPKIEIFFKQKILQIKKSIFARKLLLFLFWLTYPVEGGWVIGDRVEWDFEKINLFPIVFWQKPTELITVWWGEIQDIIFNSLVLKENILTFDQNSTGCLSKFGVFTVKYQLFLLNKTYIMKNFKLFIKN